MSTLVLDLQNNWHVGNVVNRGESSQQQQQREVLHGPLSWKEVVIFIEAARHSLPTPSFLLWHPSFPHNNWKRFEEMAGLQEGMDLDGGAAKKCDGHLDVGKTTLHCELRQEFFRRSDEGEERGSSKEDVDENLVVVEDEDEDEDEEKEEEEEEEEEEAVVDEEEVGNDAMPAAVMYEEPLADENETASTEQNDEALGYVPLVATSVATILEQSRNTAFKRGALQDLGVGFLNRVKIFVSERLLVLAED